MTATDADVLVLLTHVQTLVQTIFNFFRNGICQILPVLHSITGCDTNSYPFGAGKISPFKKMPRLSKMHLARLETLNCLKG